MMYLIIAVQGKNKPKYWKAFTENCQCAPWIIDSSPFRSCWDLTLECPVGCRAWCLLHLARCEGAARADRSLRSAAGEAAESLGRRDGETREKSEDLKFKEKKKRQRLYVSSVQLTPTILWRRMWCVSNTSLSLSLLTPKIMQRLISRSTASVILFYGFFFFSFFKYLYQHKSFLRMGYQLKLDTVKDKCGG